LGPKKLKYLGCGGQLILWPLLVAGGSRYVHVEPMFSAVVVVDLGCHLVVCGRGQLEFLGEVDFRVHIRFLPPVNSSSIKLKINQRAGAGFL